MIAGIVLKVATFCNLDCSYCYVYHGRDQSFRDRPPFFSVELAELLGHRIADYCASRAGLRLSICLHGGEPLLLGQKRFRQLVEALRKSAGPYLKSVSLQTNGLLIDPEWTRLFSDLQISVGISIDGSEADHNAERIDHMGRGSFARATQGLRLLLEAGQQASVLCVVRPGGNGARAYAELRALGVTQFDFLLPDIAHADRQRLVGHLGETPVADYLIPALDAWLAEDNPAVDIRIFRDIFRLLLGDAATTDAFGGAADNSYVVVETDGSIQANDVLRVCDDNLSLTGLNLLSNRFDELDDTQGMIADVLHGTVPVPTACANCLEAKTCAGGYLPHRYSQERGFDNPSVWCADIKVLFSKMRDVVKADQSIVAA